ncbi:hypothetical protein Zmor_010205 [Zophobas morio]|uniref:Uncharacterized protein n=1 Tax=Zophobas morio TaxID=2755281 RepID=A0AA38IK39_9CUCU|nr:hypothetical protein Zmor_010205 [Zophobas morio]
MIFSLLCFSLFLSALVESFPTICPEGQERTHDGHCVEPFHLRITPNKRNSATTKGCPNGWLLSRNGSCIQEFNKDVNTSPIPDVVVTTPSEWQRKTNLSCIPPRQFMDLPTGCADGYGLSHTGDCKKKFNIGFNISSLPEVTVTLPPCQPNQTHAFDTPKGCPFGEELGHDGTCKKPFKLKFNTSEIPNETVTASPSQRNQQMQLTPSPKENSAEEEHSVRPLSRTLYYINSYGPPCQSSCGSVQCTSCCQYLPCYQQSQYPSYYPYVYNYNYNSNSNNRRIVNSYRYPGRYWTFLSQYGNIPVDIIDDVDIDTQKVGNLPLVGKTDPYANVPVEIIDDDSYADFLRNIPKLPKVTPHAFDTPKGCPVGEELGHDGTCQNPFKLKFNTSEIPNETVTASPSQRNQQINNRRIVGPYRYPGRYWTFLSKYGNIPVDIIDDVDIDTQKMGKLPLVGKTDPYANVPVGLIVDDSYEDFLRNIPKLPKVTQSSTSH